MKKKKVQLMIMTTAFLVGGCGQTEQTDLTDKQNNVEQIQSWEDGASYEAEDGNLLGGAVTKTEGEVTYVEGLEQDGDGLELTININETGFYDIDVYSRTVDGGVKENYLLVDGEDMGTIKLDGEGFQDSVVRRVYLEAGEHVVAIKKYWGWIHIDKIMVRQSAELDESRFEVEPTLVNANADENTKRLMTYLCDMYGTNIYQVSIVTKVCIGVKMQSYGRQQEVSIRQF